MRSRGRTASSACRKVGARSSRATPGSWARWFTESTCARPWRVCAASGCLVGSRPWSTGSCATTTPCRLNWSSSSPAPWCSTRALGCPSQRPMTPSTGSSLRPMGSWRARFTPMGPCSTPEPSLRGAAPAAGGPWSRSRAAISLRLPGVSPWLGHHHSGHGGLGIAAGHAVRRAGLPAPHGLRSCPGRVPEEPTGGHGGHAEGCVHVGPASGIL